MTNKTILASLRLLARYTSGTLDIDTLAGPRHIWKRQEIMTAMMGRVISKERSGVSMLWNKFLEIQCLHGTGYVVSKPEVQKANFITWGAAHLMQNRETVI